MQCPAFFGTEFYFVAIALAVGALMNGIKRIGPVPSDAVPVLAFVSGWLGDSCVAHFMCEQEMLAAAVGGLGGGFAGLSAAGGHEALQRVTAKFGPPVSAFFDKLLGRAKKERTERPKAKSTAAMLVVIALSTVACGGALATAAKVVQVAGSAIEMIDTISGKASAYFDRHPSLDNAAAVNDLVGEVRALVEAGEHDKAVALYEQLVELLEGLGIPDAEPPEGGAENGEAPKPEPFDLPTAAEFKAAL